MALFPSPSTSSNRCRGLVKEMRRVSANAGRARPAGSPSTAVCDLIVYSPVWRCKEGRDGWLRLRGSGSAKRARGCDLHVPVGDGVNGVHGSSWCCASECPVERPLLSGGMLCVGEVCCPGAAVVGETGSSRWCSSIWSSWSRKAGLGISSAGRWRLWLLLLPVMAPTRGGQGDTRAE
jgi:hypothetical protein